MQASPIHDYFDASVLFASREAAQAAWRALTGSEAAGFTLAKGNLAAILELKSEAMPDAILDLRLVGANFDVGSAYIGIVLGVMGQFEIRQMLTNPATGQGYPDPWASTGLLRVASQVVSALLAAGGTAVVLQKAGATVKSVAMFREELGDLDDVTVRPAAAWLDLTANRTGDGGVLARSFGMRSYYGSPDVQATAATADRVAVESCMTAVRHTCFLIAGDQASPFGLKVVDAPAALVGDLAVPAMRWSVRYDAADCLLHLSTVDPAIPARRRGLLGRLIGR